MAKKYPALKKMLNEENLRPFFTCLDFDYRVRRMIYTTNAIERLRKEFRRALKIRNAMPSVDSVLLLLSAYHVKWKRRLINILYTTLAMIPIFKEKNIFDLVNES